MSEVPSLDSIKNRLRRARAGLVVTLEVSGKTERLKMSELPPSYPGSESNDITRVLLRHGGWQTDASAFVAVQDWIDVHWRTERATEAPAGTVTTSDRFGQRSEFQLDVTSAARKLIVAAARFGLETVAKYAKEFASHGMIEARSLYLLKGPAIGQVERLDDYCSIVPYGEARQRSITHGVLPPMMLDQWPRDPADNVCALECRTFERRTLHGTENALFASPLLRDGPGTLALMLGLVWGNGLRVFGNWHRVSAPGSVPLPRVRANRQGPPPERTAPPIPRNG